MHDIASQAPRDLFESEFILQLLQQYAKWCRGSCFDFGRPVGALAMAATAVSPFFYAWAIEGYSDLLG
jgi:hypothetical protein